MGHSCLSIWYNCHFFPVFGISADIPLNPAGIFRHIPYNDPSVNTSDRMSFDLFRNIHMSFVILTNNKRACCVFIDSVNNARTYYTVNTGKAVSAMIHYSIDQGMTVMPGTWMDYHAFGFIDNQNILILIQNIQRDIFRKNIYRFRFRNGHSNQIVHGNRETVFLYHLSVNRYISGFDQFLKKSS